MWISTLALLSTAILPQGGAAPAWSVHRLKNGATVHVLVEPAAPRQTAFTFLPVGLAGDRGGRAQFAHLAEHMMIRSTDPRSLRVEGIMINGETTAMAMRLETIAEPKHWEAALRRHARWLLVRSCDPAGLAREKVRIEGEERGTVPRGFNHKWAVVAWAQFLAGEKHAAVHGDVAAATPAQVEAYLARRVAVQHAQLFLIGPRSVAEQVAALEAEFGAGPHGGAAEPPARKDEALEPAFAGGEHERTWDLDAAHCLAWYQLPKECSGLTAQLFAQALTGACYQQPSLRQLPGSGVAMAATFGDRRYLVLSANLPKGTKPATVRQAFVAAVRAAGGLLAGQPLARMMRQQVGRKPDFAALRSQVRNARARDLVEAQFAMVTGYLCVRGGLPLARLDAALATLEKADLAKEFAAATKAPTFVVVSKR